MNIAASEDFTPMFVGGVVSLRNAPTIWTAQVLMNAVALVMNVKNVRNHLLWLTEKS
jgi:hypothetical protein